MKTSNPMTMALASLMLTLPSHHAIASELDAHEHGSASLDIAIDTNTIEMKFESPAVNIVGFEYAYCYFSFAFLMLFPAQNI